MVISPVLECIIRTDILSSWQNPHTDFLTCGVRTYWQEPLELPLPREIVKQKPHHSPEGTAKISDTTKDLEDAGR